MSEPKRLLSEGASDFERQLLRAVVNERPSPRLRARMQQGLGIGGAISWAGQAKAALGALTTKAGAATAVGGLVAAGGWVALVGTAREPGASEPSRASTTALVERRDDLAGTPRDSPSPFDGEEIEAGGLRRDTQLRDEIAALDAARVALQRGSFARGLELLETYDQRFPAGILQREAGLLRREALARQRAVTGRGPGPRAPASRRPLATQK